MPSFADLVLAGLLALAGPFPPQDALFYTYTSPVDLVDAEMDMDGNLYLLRSGTPHLEVHSAQGEVEYFDLDEVILPGGLFLEDRWGWWVSDSVKGMSYRFDANGVAVDSIETPGRPGDLCDSGPSVTWVARDRGALLDSRDQCEQPVLRLDGACLGQLSCSAQGMMYSDGAESYFLPVEGEPLPLPGEGTWTIAAGTRLLLVDGWIRSATETLEVPGASACSRISTSPGGRCMVLWKPGGDQVLVLR